MDPRLLNENDSNFQKQEETDDIHIDDVLNGMVSEMRGLQLPLPLTPNLPHPCSSAISTDLFNLIQYMVQTQFQD